MPLDESITQLSGRLMPKKYLIVKGSGGRGLGDRLRALLVAILYARLTGRILHVDWRDRAYGDGTQDLFHNLFLLRDVPHVAEMPSVESVWPPSWAGRLHLSSDAIRTLDGAASDGSDWNHMEAVKRYSTDLSSLDYPQDAVVMWDFVQFVKLRPYVPSLYPTVSFLSDDAVLSRLLADHLDPVEKIRVRMEDYAGQHFEGRYVVGIHVRYTQESQRARTTPTISQYLRVGESALRAAPDGALLFLSTDNKSMLELFEQHFGSEIVLWREKWFPPAGEPIHKNPSCPEFIESAMDAVVDLRLLAACNSLVVLGNSSFSIIARLWSGLPEEKVTVLWPRLPLVRRVWAKIDRIRHSRNFHYVS
jgi:hypothetical protein